MTSAEERQAKREADRMKRLSAQLRANLAKRKTQVRARRAGDEDERTGLASAVSDRVSGAQEDAGKTGQDR